MLKDIYLEISIFIPPDEDLRGKLIALLMDFKFLGIKEESDKFYFYVNKNNFKKKEKIELRNILYNFSDTIVQLHDIKEIQTENWNKIWEKSIQPIEVGKRFLITSSWHKIKNKNKIVITIDPKMAFGTGFHETTRLVLKHLEALPNFKGTVLDIGTGTGVLAIATSKLGFNKIIACDIDEWSYLNTVENVSINNCKKNIKVVMGSINNLKSKTKFDLIVCNIFKNTIIELLPDINKLTKVNGRIIFSGFLKEDLKEILRHLKVLNLKLEYKSFENEWACITVIKI
ncbi:MAG: 50S ribosomal protein L11 methyltransferase [Bacteroidetes bacterium]|nr:50S ribosomal protein L11 methyltransferase [Bacteroidota bacterium]